MKNKDFTLDVMRWNNDHYEYQYSHDCGTRPLIEVFKIMDIVDAMLNIEEEC